MTATPLGGTSHCTVSPSTTSPASVSLQSSSESNLAAESEGRYFGKSFASAVVLAVMVAVAAPWLTSARAKPYW